MNPRETRPGKGEENERKEKKKILFNVSERGGIAQTECKSGKIRIAKQSKAILVAPENEKLATFFLVEQIGKSNARHPDKFDRIPSRCSRELVGDVQRIMLSSMNN